MRSAANLAQHIRKLLRDHGSAEHATGVQWFFKEEVRSYGWYTGDLRKAAARFRRSILSDADHGYLVEVADRLFRGRILDEKNMGVLLLEKEVGVCTPKDFRQFELWLDRVTSWADHDALAHYLLGPMLAAQPKRVKRAFVWAQSPNVWHRRAAAVALIQGTRREMFQGEIVRVCDVLLADNEDMVQKGVGWLLREWAKKSPRRALPYLMKIRGQAPRLVLRTACEKLSVAERARVLGKR
jgi:3-methyladenine DNA glycosylase AlkD